MSGRSRARASQSPTVVAAALAAALAPLGCAGSDIDANPFHVGRTYSTPDGAAARVQVLGPLWDDTIAPGFRETALHPLWRRVATPTEVRTQLLAPLFANRTTADESSSRFLALAFSRTHRSANTTGDYDFSFFPLVWFGSGPRDDEDYFALFPFGGVIDSFAGFAKVGFVLFPLYYWASKEITEPETFHNVTPLIGWIDGGPRDGSWRLLPLVGHWKYDGKYDKWSFLWPLFHWQKNRLDTDDPSTDVAFWPLFGIEQSRNIDFRAFLWPFFRFRTERVERFDDANVRSETTYWRRDILWPLWKSEHEREWDYLRLFPFFSRYRSAELDSDAWMIPFFWHRTTREHDWSKETFDFVPLVHWERKRWNVPADGADEAARADDTAFKLWPLFSISDEAGGREVKVPALLPLDIERYTGDFEASWGPWFELWHTRRTADGASRGNALLRLADWESRDGRDRFSIPLLYSLDRTPTRTTHRLLFGMVRFGGGEGGAELKLLGMPLLTPDLPEGASR